MPILLLLPNLSMGGSETEEAGWIAQTSVASSWVAEEEAGT